MGARSIKPVVTRKVIVRSPEGVRWITHQDPRLSCLASGPKSGESGSWFPTHQAGFGVGTVHQALNKTSPG